MTARVSGQAEIERKLRNLGERGAINVSRRGVVVLAKAHAVNIKAEAPVLSGKLKKSIKHRRVRGTRDTVSAVVEGEWYWRLVNNGTVAQPANAFAERGIARTQADLPRLYVTEFGKQIEREAAKMASR